MPSWSLVLLVGLLLVGLYLPLPERWLGDLDGQGVIYLIIAVGSAVVVALAARRRTVGRGAWWLIAAGLAASALGDVLWTAHEVVVGTDPPFPWIADGPYVLGWLAIVVGVGALVRDPDRGRRLAVTLDAGVITLAGAVLLWLLVVADLVRDGEASGLELVVSLAYPVLDLALLGILVALLLDRRRATPTSHLIALAAGVQLVADVVYARGVPLEIYATGDPADLGWLLAYVLLAAAALHPSADRIGAIGAAPEALSHRRVLLLWVTVVSTTALAVAAGYPTVDASPQLTYTHVAVGAGATLLMASLVLWRLALAATSLSEALAERGSLQRQLEHEASHDALTGLANRRRFTEVSQREASRRDAAVVFVDLDRFKEINDRLGHTAGDEVLQVVSSRLTGALRPGDLAARLGGDEFAALVHDVGPEELEEVAARLLHLIRGPIVLTNGTEVHVDASVGTARANGDEDCRDLLHDADVAMYEAKRAGRSRVMAYSPDVHAQVTERLVLQAELRHALERGQFAVVYQPIVSVDDRRPVGVEALLRWYHPTHGTVPPDVFIPLAEASGDIIELGRWVLTEACRTIARAAREVGDLQLNVNVSAHQLHHSAFATDVEAALMETGFDPRSLTLEITESVLLEDSPLVRSSVERLCARGVRFAVDDFGTGFSALRYLRDVPLDELKIDRTFVWGIDEGPEDAALAFAILHLADSFALATVGEGVETETQLAALASRGCVLVQGYLISRPLPAETLVAWVAVHRADRAAEAAAGAPPPALR
ncbi:putative bifunctional diguanylate cyclase/phosphodiesterase [Nitriliruptor alkaliphilus]|uniref:putative bifunctional diguanylate cyclase/phosphodiesterase n=1 Tax=Nitriliruptor alkaliphilus TaxID=427918 RepID=UPI0012EE51E3|nr:GGDEF domain-containing phosphodiesterase [Nitriliruptor alkaliphilus]